MRIAGVNELYTPSVLNSCQVQRKTVSPSEASPLRVEMVRRSYIELTMEEIVGEVETKYGIMQYRKVMVRREEGSYVGVEGYL